jgi:cell volume regulation protein A
MFNAAFIIVLCSLFIQGWTIRPMARLLHLVVPPEIGPVEKFELELPGAAHHELVAYRVAADSPIATGERLPRLARPSLIIRDGQSMRYQYAGPIRPGDLVYLFAAPRYVRLLDRLCACPAGLDAEDGDFFGAFTIDPGHTIGELIETYGLSVPRADPEETIASYMLARLGGTAEIGDRVHCGTVDLIVRDTDVDSAIAAVGLAIAPSEISFFGSVVSEPLAALRERIAGLFAR